MQPVVSSVAIAAHPEAFKPASQQPHRLSYRHWGNTGETILCIHGLTRNAQDFDELASVLAERYQVLCIDMPGRGSSEWLNTPADYNTSTYIADIFHLLAVLKLQNVHWIGTSMGGIIGMTMANMRPGLIKSLLLNDIGCHIPVAGLKRILSYAGVQTTFATYAEATNHLRLICEPFGIPDEAHWQAIFASSLIQDADGSWCMHYDPAIVAPMKSVEPADVNMWPLWEAVKPIPTLLIRGEHSDILTHETAIQMRAQHPALTYYEVKNAGHAPALMSSDETGYIKNWLSKAY